MPAVWEENLEGMDAAEAHWTTGTILALFFAACLVSAVFFGLGYSFRRGGTVTPGLESVGNTSAAAATETAKPASGAIRLSRTAAQRHAALKVIPAAEISVKPNGAPASHALAAEPGAGYMVQVGAIDNRKDAQKLVSELGKRGFRAGVYPSKRDKYLHVQIGPFAAHEQARAMLHRVTGSGFHAILKHRS